MNVQFEPLIPPGGIAVAVTAGMTSDAAASFYRTDMLDWLRSAPRDTARQLRFYLVANRGQEAPPAQFGDNRVSVATGTLTVQSGYLLGRGRQGFLDRPWRCEQRSGL